MNPQMAYFLGMIIGNGEIQRKALETTISIELPHKNLKDDEGKDTQIYVKSSLADIRGIIEPLLGRTMNLSQSKRATIISFTKNNQDYTLREIMRFIGAGVHHSTMEMSNDLFLISKEEKKELLKGIADVTGYIRKSNAAYGQNGQHRVYIEIPGNWKTVIDISNLLKDLMIPVQTIDFGHPNFRDSNLNKYNEGNKYFWKKEHQIKVWADEFLPIGFNIIHKQAALEKYAKELKENNPNLETHKFYWEKPIRMKKKPYHPMENDDSLPIQIRGKHYESWTDLARDLGYHG